jgi:hypothetical protein
MKLAIFTIFFIASFVIGAGPLLLAVALVWAVAWWLSKDEPPDEGNNRPNPTPPDPRPHFVPRPPRHRRPSPRTPRRVTSL